MNKIDLPLHIDDIASLTALANNIQLNCHGKLQPHIAFIQLGYQSYIAANGNASVIKRVVLPGAIEAILKYYYSNPTKDLPHIDELRAANAGQTCPMCGSEKCGTLDHIFPKADFGCFSIFSPNLVPACDCNTRRANAVKGGTEGQRILHPYFDDILSQRLVAARFEDLGAVPKISIQVVLNVADPHYNAVCFHTDAVVRKTHVLKWMATRWASLIRMPSSRIPALQHIPANPAELANTLQEEQAFVDEDKGSRNSWESMFVSGLLDKHVIDWLFIKLTQPGRGPNTPLL